MKRFHVLLGFCLTLILAGAALAGDTPQEPGTAEIQSKCQLTCFKHSCSIECGPGKEADCICRNVDTPTGKQWIPFCQCRKASSAVQQTEAADRANISKSQGWVTLYKGSSTKCRRIKCTGGSADSGETIGIEVEVNKGSEGTLGKGQESDFEGTEIRIKSLCRMASYNLSDC